MVLALMLTKQCNFHCRHCMVDSSYDYSLADNRVIEKFIAMCRDWRPGKIYLIGGEVLLHIDVVERIVGEVRDACNEIVIFSNGTFLNSDIKTQKVKALNVTVRISDDRFHREFWSDPLKEKIESTDFWVVEKDSNEDMIPVGRAYEEFRHLQYNMGCSLLTGFYDERYPNHHRVMVMMNGDVNLYCATVEAALANVFEDESITYDLLEQREKILHNYLCLNVLKTAEDTYMAKLCNECPKYKITGKHIFYDGVKAADVKDYLMPPIDIYERLSKQNN